MGSTSRGGGGPARAVRTPRGSTFARLEALEDRRLMCASPHGGPHELSVTPQAAPLRATASAAAPVAAASSDKVSLSAIPALSSRLGALASLYLDFNGDTTGNWGGFTPGVTPAMDFDGDASTYSGAELATVRDAWARVAEDFAPFNLNVTTVDPGAYANGRAMRVVVGGSSGWYGSAVAGLSFVGAFANDQPNTSYVFVNAGAPYMADIVSHEAGHAFGLGHQEVYNADGSLADPYADGDSLSTLLMGGGGGRAVWWRGDSGGRGYLQDDADAIASRVNGFGYRLDDHGGTSFLATALARGADGAYTGAGVIETLADRDWFGFTLSTAGSTQLTVTPAAHGPNLNAKVELRDAAGNLVRAYDTTELGESFSVDLAAGSYRLGVMSHARTGDLGQYAVRVTPPVTPRV